MVSDVGGQRLRYQVTVPGEIRGRTILRTGGELLIREEGGRMLIATLAMISADFTNRSAVHLGPTQD